MWDERTAKRAVGYVRVSTEEQAEEGYSLAAQERAVGAFCEAKGWVLVRVYRDEGLSAFSGERRPGYDAMIADRETWDVIVTLKMDRLWRNMKAFLALMDDLAGWNRGYVSIGESWDTTTPMGNFVRDLFARLAQLESEQTSYRVRLAFRQKFESDGDTWYTRAPIGYNLVNGKLVLNEDGAKIVRRIFELVIAGKPTMEIVRILNAKGLRGTQGGKWAQVSIIQVAHNPVYAGYVYYQGVLRKNGHVPVIDDATFNEASLALYTRNRKNDRWPLMLGADRLEAARVITSGRGAAVYVPKVRPKGLDRELVRLGVKKAGGK